MGRTMPDSEFRTYPYITEVLDRLEWDTRNPETGGSVFWQHEFYNVDPTLTSALGAQQPEHIILIPWDDGPRYWIIEAKRNHDDREKALKEARDYANAINATKPGSARFATGIAGTPDRSYYVTTEYWTGTEWREVEINNYTATGFLTLSQCRDILDRNSPHIVQYIVDIKAFLNRANEINRTLHENGVAARDRAALVAGLLLALAQDSTMRIENEPITLVNDINGRISTLLQKHGRHQVIKEVELKLPSTPQNHRKYWAAIVQTMQHLREMNIRSAINSGTDALGQFYETFLQYANDASEMGIVLTPRHITKFAVDVVGIKHQDRVFDPTCGTAGFLVAALDTIRAEHYDEHFDVYSAFRNDCLFGVEQADNVFGLALVNMIFRGDGKSQIYNGNCFDNDFYLDGAAVTRQGPETSDSVELPRPFSRVLMNPPFALKTEPERQFVDYALRQMSPGGLLFAILPNGPITGDNSEKTWRRALLTKNTVRAVVRMPDDLFSSSSVSKGTYALVIQAGRKHQADDDVFFAQMYDDQSATGKSKLLSVESARDNVAELTKNLRTFIATGVCDLPDRPDEFELGKLDMSRSGLYDFASEAYLRSPEPQEHLRFDAAHGLLTGLIDIRRAVSKDPEVTIQAWHQFNIEDLFEVRRGPCPPLKNMQEGVTPVISCTETRNGIAGYFGVAKEMTFQDCVTISGNGSNNAGRAFWHPYEFSAVGDVLVCDPKPDLPRTMR